MYVFNMRRCSVKPITISIAHNRRLMPQTNQTFLCNEEPKDLSYAKANGVTVTPLVLRKNILHRYFSVHVLCCGPSRGVWLSVAASATKGNLTEKSWRHPPQTSGAYAP